MKIKKLNPSAIIPTLGTPGAACYDLYACLDEPISIEPGKVAMIGTGLAIQPNEGMCGLILARSGMATKRGLRPANCVGCCDIDYRGEYICAMRNDSDEIQVVNPGDRIAQLMFVKYWIEDWEIVDELDPTTRGDGGFGSTGTR
jgi:dUTP pyrophosphatase